MNPAVLTRLDQLEQEWQQRLLMQPSGGPPQRPGNDERRLKQAQAADLPQKECQGSELNEASSAVPTAQD